MKNIKNAETRITLTHTHTHTHTHGYFNELNNFDRLITFFKNVISFNYYTICNVKALKDIGITMPFSAF